MENLWTPLVSTRNATAERIRYWNRDKIFREKLNAFLSPFGGHRKSEEEAKSRQARGMERSLRGMIVNGISFVGDLREGEDGWVSGNVQFWWLKCQKEAFPAMMNQPDNREAHDLTLNHRDTSIHESFIILLIYFSTISTVQLTQKKASPSSTRVPHRPKWHSPTFPPTSSRKSDASSMESRRVYQVCMFSLRYVHLFISSSLFHLLLLRCITFFSAGPFPFAFRFLSPLASSCFMLRLKQLENSITS